MEKSFDRHWSKIGFGIKLGMVWEEEHECSPIKLYLQKSEHTDFELSWMICLPVSQDLELKWQFSKDDLVDHRETWKGVEKKLNLGLCQESIWKRILWLIN